MLKLAFHTLRCLAVGALLAILELQTSVAAQTKNAAAHIQSNEQARQLWEAAIAAKGGRERLRQITSLYVAADQGQGDRQNTFYVFPGYSFDYAYNAKRESTGIQISNAELGIVWWQPNGSLAKPIKYSEEDVYLNLLPQFLYLMVTHDIDPIPLRARKERIGFKRVDVVETDTNGWRVDYYLDAATHLPVRAVLPLGPRLKAEGAMDHIVTLNDYAEVSGVMMPHMAVHTFTFNSPNWKDRLTFEINPQYDPQFFEQSPTARMGPESWRLPRANARN